MAVDRQKLATTRPQPTARPAQPRLPERPAGAPPRRPLHPPAPAIPVARLVLVPALVTLAVTLVRLFGELRGLSPAWFSRLPGGGLAIVGITWLVPVVGLHFGCRLHALGERPPDPGRALGLPLAALALAPVLAWLASRLHLDPTPTARIGVWAVVSIPAVALVFAAWPALGRVLLAYALAARVPVAALMLVAMYRLWGTHYDAPVPGFPSLPPLRRWLWTGLLPQATIWVAITVGVGAFFGALGERLAARVRGSGLRLLRWRL